MSAHGRAEEAHLGAAVRRPAGLEIHRLGHAADADGRAALLELHDRQPAQHAGQVDHQAARAGDGRRGARAAAADVDHRDVVLDRPQHVGEVFLGVHQRRLVGREEAKERPLPQRRPRSPPLPARSGRCPARCRAHNPRPAPASRCWRASRRTRTPARDARARRRSARAT